MIIIDGNNFFINIDFRVKQPISQNIFSPEISRFTVTNQSESEQVLFQVFLTGLIL